MKKISVIVLALAVLAFAGCQGKAAEPAKAAAPTVTIAMVTDTGGVNDKSFNQGAWEGLQRAEKELGIGASYKESKQEADYDPNLAALVDEKKSLIWGIGYMMAGAVDKAAEANPGTQFAIIDMPNLKNLPNLTGVTFKAQEGSFLVGYIAGKMSKTGKVGFVGGQKGFVIDGFEYGFRAGVMQANPKATVFVQYADSWADQPKGKQIALQMVKDGADVLFAAAGATGLGLIEAAKEKKVYAIGVDVDQAAVAPDTIITSALKRVDNAIFNLAKEVADGTYKGGASLSLGLAEDAVGYVKSSFITDALAAELEALKAKIVAGDIVVPFNADTFKAFSPAK